MEKEALKDEFFVFFLNGLFTSKDFWGDENTLQAAADIYNTRFRIYNIRRDHISTITPTKISSFHRKQGYLLFHNKHYQPLIEPRT